MNELERECGERSLHPHHNKKRSYAEQLPDRVVKNIIGEEEVE